MTFPAEVQTVTVTLGPVLDVAGAPVVGELLVLESTETIKLSASGRVVPSRAHAYTGADGRASVTVIATDSPGIDRTGWTYALSGAGNVKTPVFLPAAFPEVAVEDLAPVAATSGSILFPTNVLADMDEVLGARDVAVGAASEAEATASGMVVSGAVVGDDLRLTRQDGTTVTAGNVRGPKGDTGPSGIVTVSHGEDATVARPDAAVVYWIGTVLPANAIATDLWYEG